jgi:hypothetical protein
MAPADRLGLPPAGHICQEQLIIGCDCLTFDHLAYRPEPQPSPNAAASGLVAIAS